MVYRTKLPSLWLYGGHSGNNFTALWSLTSGQATDPPILSSFNPAGGQPGDPVRLNGLWLGSATEVRFNGTLAPSSR
jgi:hypothetical protein